MALIWYNLQFLVVTNCYANLLTSFLSVKMAAIESNTCGISENNDDDDISENES